MGRAVGDRERPADADAAGWRPLAVWILTALTGCLVVAYVASTVFRQRNTTSVLFDGWIGNAGYAGTAALVCWRVVRVRQERAAWAALGVSIALFTVGAVLWTTIVQFEDPVPYPSYADVFFLVFYPVAYAGIGLLVRDTVARQSRHILLDGLVAALGFAALEASIVIGHISQWNQGNFAAVVTTITYPIGDLVLVMMVLVVFSVTRWRPPLRWWILGAGVTLFAAADSVYVLRVTSGSYVTGTPLDSVWLVGTFLVAVAAWQRPDPIVVSRHRSIVVPGFCFLSSLAVVLYATFNQVLLLGLALATATLLVSAVRMALDYRQLRQLSDTRREARTDELTGLPNRRFFYEALSAALRDRSDERIAVLMIDLNQFKEINDSLGHRVGDDVLRQLGPRLLHAAGEFGTVGRLGGDEFGMFVAPLPDDDVAERVAEALRDSLLTPFALEGVSLHVDASVGIAIAPDHGATIDLLLQNADVAMYEAKRAHVPWRVYSPERDAHTRGRLQLMEDLRSAITNDELLLHYQPQVNLVTGEVDAVEALVRWQHPTRGLLLPGEFLAVAEHTGLIGPLTMTVIETALRQQQAWDREGLHVCMSINLSAANLLDEGLPLEIARRLEQCGASPDRVLFELTEDSVMADPAIGRRVLAELNELGVAVSIDDYGTGFSSLAYLKHLSVQELKLDRSFIVDVPVDDRAVAIVRSTIELAHSLGLRLIAEGVESELALLALRDLGCDAVQGYYLSRPAAASDLRHSIEQAQQRCGAARCETRAMPTPVPAVARR